MKEIYLDHSATTYVDSRVEKAMAPFFSKEFGNSGSFNTVGLRAKHALDSARQTVANILVCAPKEIIFTGSGTESDNLAIQGLAKIKGSGHIITQKTEHHAVLDTCKALEKEGFSVTYLNVDKFGRVDPRDVEKAIQKDTILITIMYANNEIGTIQPIKEIAKIAQKHKIIMHTDACQAGAYLPLMSLGVDMMTLNGSKIYGPKGVGVLYKRAAVKIKPIIHGGGQEFGLRSGTENISGIVGFAKALKIAQADRSKESTRLNILRAALIKGILKIPKTVLNGHPKERLPNNVNVSILDIEGEALILRLNEKGIQAATGSACSSKSLTPSHVLLAIGQPAEVAHGSLRLTLGRKNNKQDIDYVLKVLPKIVEDLRSISPVRIKRNGRR